MFGIYLKQSCVDVISRPPRPQKKTFIDNKGFDDSAILKITWVWV